MSSVKYAVLFDEVMPEVGGALPALVENAIRNAVIDFCDRSTVWRYWPDPQDVQAGENTYDLEPDTGADVVRVVAMALGGHPVYPASEADLASNKPDWRTTGGTPRHFMQQDTTQVVLSRVPDAAVPGGLVMTLALKPIRTGGAFPRWIWVKYADALAAGAKARLMAMPRMPWTNPNLSLYYQGIFDAAVAGANADASRSLASAPLRTTSHH